MTACLRQAGLTVKVRARYGKQLTEAELSAISELGSIEETCAFLQDRSEQELSLAIAGNTHRRLALTRIMEEEFRSLGRFVPPGDKAFWQFFPHMQALRRLMSDYHSFRSGEDFCNATSGTIYEAGVRRIVQKGSLPDCSAAEALLYSRYDSYMLRLIQTRYQGAVNHRLKRLLGEATDRLNLLNLLRLKAYFPAEAQTLARYLPARYRLSRQLYTRLSAAKTMEETRSLLAAEPHFAALAHLPLPALAQEQVDSLRRLYRQVIRSGEPSIAVAFAYLCDRAYAMEALAAVLDTVAEREASKKEATVW